MSQTVGEKWEQAHANVLRGAISEDRHIYIGMVQDLYEPLKALWQRATAHQEVLCGIQNLNLEHNSGVIAVSCIPQEALALPEALALQELYPAQKAA